MSSSWLSLCMSYSQDVLLILNTVGHAGDVYDIRAEIYTKNLPEEDVGLLRQRKPRRPNHDAT